MIRPECVNFFCIGAQKAGTTTLHNILIQHPEIYLPPKKEAHFFDINERYERGLDYYFSNFFNTYNGEKIVGNINPNLEIDNRSLDRIIHSFGKNVKIIFIMRDPVNRAYSHYLMTHRRGYEKLSFLEALDQEPNRLENPKFYKNYRTNEIGHYEKNNFGYIHRSQYLKKIEYLHQILPKKNIKLIVFENFISEKKKYTNEILDFIEVENYHSIDYDIKSNSASKPKSEHIRDVIYNPGTVLKFIGSFFNNEQKNYIKSKLLELNSINIDNSENKLDNQTRQFVYKKYFQEEVIKLESLLGISLGQWKH